MGSWNETCGVTQLPILEGDEVVLFIVKSELEDPRFPEKIYKPYTLPIFGEYNDYGQITNIEDIDNLVFNHMENTLEEDFDNLEEILHNIERGNIEDFKIMMIHRRLYNTLINELSNTSVMQLDSFFYTSSKTPRDMLTFKRSIFEEIDRFIELHKSKKNNNNPHLDIARNRYVSMTDGSFEYFRDVKLIDEEFKERFANFIIFNNAMETLRNSWYPQEGRGSQSIGLELFDIKADFIKDYKKSYDSEFQE